MTATVINDGLVLKDVLDMIDASSVRGCLTPHTVISAIDNISASFKCPVPQLPASLQMLRRDAQMRRKTTNAGYRQSDIADKIVMSGMWPV